MMDVIERIRSDCLNDLSRANIIYTCLLVATTSAADQLFKQEFLTTSWPLVLLLEALRMSFANASHFLASAAGASTSLLLLSSDSSADEDYSSDHVPGTSQTTAATNIRPSLLARMSRRLGVWLDNLAGYLASQLNEHTAASIASASVLIIVLSIIGCFIMSLMREEERRIKEQYRKLGGTGSSQSFIAIQSGAGDGRGSGAGRATTQRAANMALSSTGGPSQQQSVAAATVAAANKQSTAANSLAQFQCGTSMSNGHNQHQQQQQQQQQQQRGRHRHHPSHQYQKIIDSQSSIESGSSGGPSADPPSGSSVTSATHLLHQDHRRTHASPKPPTTTTTTTTRCHTSEQNHHHNHHQHHNHNNHSYHLHHQHQKADKVRLHELRRETYFGLVRLSRPGCRTVVLLCDAQSRAKLLRRFHQCVFPYRKNKTLQFAFLLIERNIGWYEDLLKSVLSERCPEGFRINPINCIGTVLVLNGFKKFFSVYHASSARWSRSVSGAGGTSGGGDSGARDLSIDEDEEPPSLLLEEALLDNLPEWLERVFAGKVNRYYVESWPDRVQHLY